LGDFVERPSVIRKDRCAAGELRPLAGLWRDKERTEEACELLAPVYGQFTEGFETTDLKAAKPLVDYLRRL
jgi:predicted ATPase